MYRNRKLLDLVRDCPCQRCGVEDGTVVAAHWHRPDGTPVHHLAGNFLPLLMCCPEEVESSWEADTVTEKFFTPTENLVLAHRAMLAAIAGGGDTNWRQVLLSDELHEGRRSVEEAAVDAINKGMVSYVIHVEPHVRPPFLPQRKRQQPRHLQPPAQEGGT